MAHKISKEQMLEAIQGSQGLVSKIQRKLEAILGEKISWDTTEKWIHKWEEAEIFHLFHTSGNFIFTCFIFLHFFFFCFFIFSIFTKTIFLY